MLPPQAEADQIEQAYQERMGQTAADGSLWPGFSSEALAARQQVLEAAAQVLLDPEQRGAYDRTVPTDATLAIDDHMLPGALIILCEIGDYETAQHVAEGLLEQESPAFEDAILTLAIARLEMGREAWQEEAYEDAAQWLETALAELETNQLFPNIQSELATDLGKLRPYRILHLLGTETSDEQARDVGLNLLTTMLDDRNGIEGSGQDGSGLNTEDFLRFIQRVRRYLTIAEQEIVFEAERSRPSMVATYLMVQVLLTRGYTENRPALVRSARSLLSHLSQHQDVHLEQAISALLLGLTDEALRHLELTGEVEPLAYIRDHSSEPGDLLLGLCRYTEKWFGDEVFQEFYQLDLSSADLNTYFDNPLVQTYLEEMPDLVEDTSMGIPPHLQQRASPPSIASSSVQIPAFTRPGHLEQTPEAPAPAWDPAVAGATWSSSEWAAESTEAEAEPPTPVTAKSSNGYSGTSDPYLPPSVPSNTFEPQAPNFNADDDNRTEEELTVPRVADLPTPSPDMESNPRMSPRSRPRSSPSSNAFKPLGFLLTVTGLAFVVLFVLQAIFGVPSNDEETAPPDPEPQVEVETPAVSVTTTPTPIPTPIPSPTPDIPVAWQGVDRVRVISPTGLNLRSGAGTAAPVVTGLASQTILRVLDVEESSGNVQIWLQVQTEGGVSGWVAADVNGSDLVEKL